MLNHKFSISTHKSRIKSTLLGAAGVFALASLLPAPAKIVLGVQASTTSTTSAPHAQAYVSSTPPARVVQGHTMVPLWFLRDGVGASVSEVKDPAGRSWRISYFGQTVQIFANQFSARLNDQPATMPIRPHNIGGQLYVPWTPIAEFFGLKWSEVPPANPADKDKKTVFLMPYPAAYVESVNHSVTKERIRLVYQLSNPTRISAGKNGDTVNFHLAAARHAGVESITAINDNILKHAVIHSGDWKADITLAPRNSAPVRWHTLGNPPRLVVDIDKEYEHAQPQSLANGISITQVTRGMEHGPVRMWIAKVDPKAGWRLKVASAGQGVLQRARTSTLASRNGAPIAINGGFFAFDGAAVGAVLINGEWVRLPWQGRTAIGFNNEGKARIGNLQANAQADFGSGLKIPVRDLNGWPDNGRVTALTPRFGNYYKLRPGEIAVEVKDGKVVSKPGSGGVTIHNGGFTLVASGGARPVLDQVRRGDSARLNISAIGWNGYTSALGGGPRLLKDGQVHVTQEGFRPDVLNGRGPRTAIGLDKQGNYIIIVVDGRSPGHSGGLTLTELAYTMQKYGAVDAMNLDGGGSTVMYAQGRVINRPSDGFERSVSNALLVTRG